jgi:hypothetical protein
MLYVKIAVTDYDGKDVQYVEVLEGTSDCFPITHLTNRDPWVVKAPSSNCVHVLKYQVPGCEVKVYNHVVYLMSPKALQYFPTHDMHRDVMLLTFHMPGNEHCHFLMTHLKNMNFWHLPWTTRGNLYELLQQAFGLTKRLKKIGFWRIMRKHHKVIDLQTFIHFRLFHCSLTFEEIETLFAHCGVTEALQTTESVQTFGLENNSYLHSLMVVSKLELTKLPKVVLDVTVDSWHTDAVHVCLDTGVPVRRNFDLCEICA